MKLTPIQMQFLARACETPSALAIGTYRPTERALERLGLIESVTWTAGDGYVVGRWLATEKGLAISKTLA
jgi:hypothetical protein